MYRPKKCTGSGIFIYVKLFVLVAGILHWGCGSEKQEAAGVAEESAGVVDTAPEISASGKTVVSEGDTVRVVYKGTFADGSVFDRSPENEPLRFIVGAGEVIPGFEAGILGMSLNEEKTITVKPEDAYGLRDEKLIRGIPKAMFPADVPPEIGKSINLHTRDGQELPATIIKIEADTVTLDFNHHLAGKELTFQIKVVGIN